MGQGQSKAGGGGLEGRGTSPTDVKNIKDMISQRRQKQESVDEVLYVSKRMTNLYGDEGQIRQFQTADMKGAFAYYDSDGNIAMNNKYMNKKGMDAGYDASVKTGFHPSRGNKSGIQAVASHEYGHALADKAGRKLGKKDIESGSREIVERARRKTGHKTNMSFAGNISGYAKYNFAECVAEGVADWYCNGSRAKKESRAIMAVINSTLKKR